MQQIGRVRKRNPARCGLVERALSPAMPLEIEKSLILRRHSMSVRD
jgi:hypothetical protein